MASNTSISFQPLPLKKKDHYVRHILIYFIVLDLWIPSTAPPCPWVPYIMRQPLHFGRWAATCGEVHLWHGVGGLEEPLENSTRLSGSPQPLFTLAGN